MSRITNGGIGSCWLSSGERPESNKSGDVILCLRTTDFDSPTGFHSVILGSTRNSKETYSDAGMVIDDQVSQSFPEIYLNNVYTGASDHECEAGIETARGGLFVAVSAYEESVSYEDKCNQAVKTLENLLVIVGE